MEKNKAIKDNIRLNYQLSLFGAFPEINYNNVGTVTKLTNEFSKDGFLPSITQGINVTPGIINVNNRIQLYNSDGFSLLLDENRLDITISFDDNIPKYYNLSESDITSNLFKYCKKICELFDCKINRLGFNTTDILSNKNAKKVIDSFNSCNKIAKFYNGKESNEWNEKIVVKEKGKALKEDLNCVTNISRGIGRVQRLNKYIDFNGVILQFDINTLAENLDFRFDDKSIQLFLTDVIKLKKEIEDTIV